MGVPVREHEHELEHGGYRVQFLKFIVGWMVFFGSIQDFPGYFFQGVCEYEYRGRVQSASLKVLSPSYVPRTHCVCS